MRLLHHRLSSTFHMLAAALGLLSLPSSSVMAQFSEAVAEKIKKSTVRVVTFIDGDVDGTGSGFILSKEGHVATNRHVIEGVTEAFVLYAAGERVFARAAKLIAVSSLTDLAILKIDPIPLTEVVTIATPELATGQGIITVGFPGKIDAGTWLTLEGVEMGKQGEGRIKTVAAQSDFVPIMFSGEVAKISRKALPENLESQDGVLKIYHSAKMSHGNSGGPLIDFDGRVCGINTWGLADGAVDYPISIHASELAALAKMHSIPITITNSKVSGSGLGGKTQALLIAAVVGLSIITFLMVLQKPRRFVLDGFTQLVRPSGKPRVTEVGRVSVSNPGGRLYLRGRDLQGQSYHLPFDTGAFRQHGGRLFIGRKRDLCQLHVPHDSVSRQHAVLTMRDGTVFLEDRNSGNGTLLNGKLLSIGSASEPLRSGDRIKMGEVELVFDMSA